MDMLAGLLSGLPNFLIYFATSIAFVLIFKFIYVRITPYDEWSLIKDDKSVTAAVALGGAFLGYCLAIAGAAQNSVNIVDFMVWGVIAMVAQFIAFAIVRFLLLKELTKRIENDELPAGIVLAVVSVSIGILNAACLTY
ncbi:DUF350 domain-containing protein [Enterovibrio norvegicus]|uniref:DUF350 domain-containing protein n=1 Tax=Enterovibrio norvegicus TaxID=188144 RepID=A0A2N7L901_9GAMM|nr:DUF350 domain-containing protein [Enterovibrio norvegicus]PML81869.1 hypothetical protein BCT69_00560 [Enterovibrio norvegicus]PMN72159.1 hypothetical protein BCT27_15010 [Enterovibrio norvegicus]PMN90801.1 hypothetical protein BCT23_18970 [Enterovibrio norvegicus]